MLHSFGSFKAFGVGAFEDEDDDIYTNFDLSQYDFEVGASSSAAVQDVPKCFFFDFLAGSIFILQRKTNFIGL